MAGTDWTILIPLGVALVSAVFGVIKYMQYSLDQHTKNANGRFKAIEEKAKADAAIAMAAKERAEQLHARSLEHIEKMRKEMHDTFALRREHEQLADTFKQGLGEVFNRLGGIAKDLNQLIGKVNANDNTNN